MVLVLVMRFALRFALILLAVWHTQAIYRETFTSTLQPPVKIRNDAFFGYSVTYQRKSDRLIISAPKADIIGNIYECNVASLKCSKIISNISNEFAGMTDMWLGASMASGDGFTIACAPKYVEKLQYERTCGKCYRIAENEKNFTMMSPLPISVNQKGHASNEVYMDSLGWSLNVDVNNTIMVGGPALYKGSAITYLNVKATPTLLNIKKWGIKNNFGYSITSGYFKSGKTILYAISSPYGSFGEGKVILTDGVASWELEEPRDFKPSVGSLFGSSMCAARLRGPRQREALIVGAALFAQKEEMDRGIVYIYQYDVSQRNVVHQRTILGYNDGGRFGSTLLNLGDLNGDHKDDIAISAPYENDGQGAVYIYSGREILRDQPVSKLKWLQKIQPKGFLSLGLSLGLLQNQNNACNDLAIGAPESNRVLLLHCIPSVVIRVKSLEDSITPKYQQAKRNESFFVYKSCVNVQYPKKPDTIKAEFSVKVSLIHLTAKIVNAKNAGSLVYPVSISKTKKYEYCEDVQIHISEEGNYDPSIQYQITAHQINGLLESKRFDRSHALMSDVSDVTLTDTLLVTNCAGVCNLNFNLQIHSSIQPGYLIGSTDTESVNLTLINKGDDAYGECLVVSVAGVRVRRLPHTCSFDDEDIVCMPTEKIRSNRSWETGAIELDTKSLTSDMKFLNLTAKIYNKCAFRNKGKQKKLVISLRNDPIGLVIMSGQTTQTDNVFLTNYEIEQTEKQLTHTYTIYNNGLTVWVDLDCVISIDKKSYYEDLVVNIDTRETYKCEKISENTQDQFFTTCAISKLRRSDKIVIYLTVYIEPGHIDEHRLNSGNLTLSSKINVTFGDRVLLHSINSTLKLKEAKVPLYIIVLAGLVGLFIVIIISIALYECGFMRRENKEKLEKLKKDVHRQSVRRSMRASTRQKTSSSTTELIECMEGSPTKQEFEYKKNVPAQFNCSENDFTAKESDSNTGSTEIDLYQNHSVLRSAALNRDVGDENSSEIYGTQPYSAKNIVSTPIGVSSSLRKELIVLGLQKNIDNGRFRPRIPKKEDQPPF